MMQEAYGVIVFKRPREEDERMLLICSVNGSWGFPKGRPIDIDATPKDTALRELAEETGLVDIDLDSDTLFTESYTLPEKYGATPKRSTYFVGFTDNSDIVIQKDEVQKYEWVTIERARELIVYDSRRRLLEEVQTLIDNLK